MANTFLDATGLAHFWGKLKSYFVRGNAKIFYGTCSTAAATVDKVVECSDFTSNDLVVGTTVYVRITVTNTGTVGSLTMNVNGTGAKGIRCIRNGGLTSLMAAGYFSAGKVYPFTYDGSYWVTQIHDNLATPANIGFGFGKCTTAEGTSAKAVTLSGYNLRTGGIFSVRFTYTVLANATLNVNSKGAKNIYFQNARLVGGVIKGGDTVTFIYDGTNYHVIANDRWGDAISDINSSLSSHATRLTTLEGDAEDHESRIAYLESLPLPVEKTTLECNGVTFYFQKVSNLFVQVSCSGTFTTAIPARQYVTVGTLPTNFKPNFVSQNLVLNTGLSFAGGYGITLTISATDGVVQIYNYDTAAYSSWARINHMYPLSP